MLAQYNVKEDPERGRASVEQILPSDWLKKLNRKMCWSVLRYSSHIAVLLCEITIPIF